MDILLMCATRSGYLLAVAAVLSAGVSAQAADAGRGADVFDSNCAECHSLARTIKNKKGPSLFGILDRPAASVNGFDYSDALRNAKFVWDAEHLDHYVADPRALVPQGKMKFDGLTDSTDRSDLIAFLGQQK